MKNIQLLVQVTRSSITVIINFLLIVIPMRHAYIYTCVEYSTNIRLIYKIRIFFVYGLQSKGLDFISVLSTKDSFIPVGKYNSQLNAISGCEIRFMKLFRDSKKLLFMGHLLNLWITII